MEETNGRTQSYVCVLVYIPSRAIDMSDVRSAAKTEENRMSERKARIIHTNKDLRDIL